ncbi:zf-DHHC-domain-containing protein [Chiua virens]|nr:zf-DHHC-domain-containing protein [Chiua virens]
MICARQVFRCFKWVEHVGDQITGAAGPYFVGLAVILISLGTLSFFTVVQPNLSYPWLSTPPCLLIALNLYMHYYYVCTTPPGFVGDPPRHAGADFLWASPTTKKQPSGAHGVRWSSPELDMVSASTSRCKRCQVVRPERAHHCRICNKCVLKYDHHCPVGINQCVGLHNERHFVLFMTYLVIGSLFFVLLGYQEALDALGLRYVFWSCSFGIFWGSYVAKLPSKPKTIGYIVRWHKTGERTMPYTDGHSWARRRGLERHLGVREGEELTDDDEDSWIS